MQMFIYYVDSATGETHKRLRNEFNMGFTAARVRSYYPIFEKVAQAVRSFAHIILTSLTPSSVCPDHPRVRNI